MKLDRGDKEVEPQHPLDQGGWDALQVEGWSDDEDLEKVNQTEYLLNRLEELKMWQKEQEIKLMVKQKEEMEQMKAEGIPIKFDSINDYNDDDDATIDQDVSSLTSYEETPRNGFNQAEQGCHQNQVPSGFGVPEPNFEVSGSSSATQSTKSEHSQDPQTIFHRNLGPSPRKTKTLGISQSNCSGQDQPAIPNPEEKPICVPNKNFEELLAEQLGVGTDTIERNNDLSVTERKNADSKKNKTRSFLRKGSGLARYGGMGSPPKAFHKNKSQSNGSKYPNEKRSSSSKSQNQLKSIKSCSKLDIAERETTASTSKKQASENSTAKSISVTTSDKLHSKKALQNCAEERLRQASPVHDSVELSFQEKLKKSGEKQKCEMEDLSAFERLEEATCDSSFCSSSSRIQNLLKDLRMPSPILKPKQGGSEVSVTSTPKPDLMVNNHHPKENAEKLSREIQNFLVKRGAGLMSEEENITEEEDATETPNLSLSGDENLDDLSDPITIGRNYPNDQEVQGDEWDSLEDDKDFDKQRRVRFSNKNGKGMERHEPMEFSPPRIPQNAASHYIWNIFSNERSEKQKTKSKKNGRVGRGNKKPSSPLSQVPLKEPEDLDCSFENVLLNAKLTELSHEISKFKKESLELSQMKRKLYNGRKKLALEIETFEKGKEAEKKKIEEEKRWLKRDKNLLEKNKRDKRVGEDQRMEVQIEELQHKILDLEEESQRKESKWTVSINKLQEQLKYYERENQILHEENHKLKLKQVTPKVSSHLTDKKKNASAHVVSLSNGYKQQPTRKGADLKVSSPVSGNVARSAFETPSSERGQDSISNGKQNTAMKTSEPIPKDLITTPRMNFSPADSLDSNMTPVSCSVHETRSVKKNQSIPVLQNIHNDSKGITEKLYDNGSLELVSANGDIEEETLKTRKINNFNCDSHTWHSTYPNKKKVLRFKNGQEEIRFPDGSLYISFQDGSSKRVNTDGSEEILMADGTRVEVNSSGDKTLYLPNGEREIQTPEYNRHEYRDGSIKTVFIKDGRQETRCANGWVRIRSKDGTLLRDSF